MDIHIAVISLWAEDVSAAIHFYRDVVGLPFQAISSGGHPHFDLGGTYLTILRGRPAVPPDPETRFPVVAFATPDLNAALKKLHSLAVDMPWGVETNATGRWVMFQDPAGNLIELVEFTQ